MQYRDTKGKLEDYRRQIASIRERMREAVAATKPQPVEDYAFANTQGAVRLSELFDGHEDLIVIHNMGVSCSACTLWADGYNGVHPHIISRAGFVVSSPDSPPVQAKFAQSRGWRFPMVSHAGASFARDMGFVSEQGGWTPGVSVFRRDGEAIVRVSDASFSPGDDFCVLWHFFDLLPGGAGARPGPAPKQPCCDG